MDAIHEIDTRFSCVPQGKGLSFINERSFAYELYRKWASKISEPLILNAEVSKSNERFHRKALKIYGKEQKRFDPDIVLHHSQLDSDEQALICEIKTDKYLTSKKLYQDLCKLQAYTTQDDVLYHAFDWGVFILVGGSFEKIVKLLKGIKYHKFINSRISCIVVNVQCNNVIAKEELLSNLISKI